MAHIGDVLAGALALGMAGGSDLNLPASGNAPPGDAHLQAIILAFGQAFVVLAFVGVTIYLLAFGKSVDGQLWTLDVSLVSFFIGQRVNLVKAA